MNHLFGHLGNQEAMLAELPPSRKIPDVSEADARGDIADVFDDIRHCLGTPMVNLIWRQIAAIEGALPPVWHAVRPLYLGPWVMVHARHVFDGLDVPTLDYSQDQLSTLVPGSGERARLRATLATFRQANLQNLLCLTALRLALETPQSVMANTREDKGGRAPGIGPSGPPLPPARAFTSASTHEQSLIRRFNAIAAGPATELEQATLPRILLHWPRFLEVVTMDLERLSGMHDLNQMRMAIWQWAVGAGAELRSHMAYAAVADAVRDRVLGILGPFLPDTLCRMLVLLNVIRVDGD